MKIIMEIAEDFVKLLTIASFKFIPSALYTIDIVLIIASLANNPVIRATEDFQFANPENEKTGAIIFPKVASKLFELSSMNLIFWSKDCKNQMTIDEPNMVTPTCSRKSFVWSHKWRYKL